MTKPVVNIADVPLREGGDGAGFVAKLGRVGAPAGDASTARQIVNAGTAELRRLGFSIRLDPDALERPDANKFAVAPMAPPDQGSLRAKFVDIGRREGSLGDFGGEK